MDKIKLTIKEVNEKAQMLNSIHTNANDKLNYAVKKVFKNIEQAISPIKTEYNRSIEDARIKHASTYPKDHPEVEKRGLLITDDKGSYSYTPEATVAFNKETRPLNDSFESQLIEIEPYMAGEGKGWERVDGIDLFIKEELIGLLFKQGTTILDDKEEIPVMHIEHKKEVDSTEYNTTHGIPVEQLEEPVINEEH